MSRRGYAAAGLAVLGGLSAAILWSAGAPLAARQVQSPDASPLLDFVAEQAEEFNGDIPSALPEPVCGSSTQRFLGELLENPFAITVPYRLADVKEPPSAMVLAGTAEDVYFAIEDFPFDHTMGSDFLIDVVLDAPYQPLAQLAGEPGELLHTELAAGQLPHEEDGAGAQTGETWEELAERSKEDFMAGMAPETGDRLIMMGNWVVDCGHLDFQTEFHPMTFLASASVHEDATVAHAFYNPYRESQLYTPDPALAPLVNDAGRLDDPRSVPFPEMLLDDIARLSDSGEPPFESADRLESWALMEANTASPVDWLVCAPPQSASHLHLEYEFVARPGVEIFAEADESTGCATVHTDLGSQTTPDPVQRECVTPWDFLNVVAAEEAGVEGLDLQGVLAALVPAEYRDRVEVDPVMNCHDPLSGPALAENPQGQEVRVDESLAMPFYGAVEVYWSDEAPSSDAAEADGDSNDGGGGLSALTIGLIVAGALAVLGIVVTVAVRAGSRRQ